MGTDLDGTEARTKGWVKIMDLLFFNLSLSSSLPQSWEENTGENILLSAMSEQAKSYEGSDCSKTAYSEWHSRQLTEGTPLNLNELRTNLLQVDRSQKDAWRIMKFDMEHNDFLTRYDGKRPESLNITIGQAMELSSAWCRDNMYALKGANAGSHGPPSSDRGTPTIDNHGAFLLAIHDAMCSRYCLASDVLRANAIAESKCHCLELSTDLDDITYTKEGDFCLKSSGHLLCNQIEHYSYVCKQCELKDFACARREYDALQVPLRGYGNECSAGTRSLCSTLLIIAAYAVNSLIR